MAPSTSPKIVASFTKTRAAALTGAGFMGVTGTLARAIAGSRRIAAIASGRRVTERRASVAPADGLMQGRCLSAAESAGAPSDWVRSAAARRRPSRTRIGARFGNHIGSVDLSRSSLGGLVIGWAVVPVARTYSSTFTAWMGFEKLPAGRLVPRRRLAERACSS